MIWPFSLLERRSVDTPTDEELAALTGAIAGTAGLGVALTVPAVKAAIRVIAEAAACLDIGIVEIAEDGTETPVRSHSVAQLLADQSNDWQSTFDLPRDLVPEVRTQNIATDGQRDVPCVNIAPSEAETFRAKFLRSLAGRGLSNVKQVISSAHEGIKASVLKAWRERGCATVSISCATL
ncbi:MAG: phage portal protein, family [Proteobacteria bacterium]|nr:phage portal protein, family [Pseudomonadota bacterium]